VTQIQIESTKAPFDRPQTARRAASVLIQAEAMGLLEGLDIRHLDEPSFDQALKRIAGAGIGKGVKAAWVARTEKFSAEELDGLLAQLAEDLEMSAVPVHEWRSLDHILGTSVLAKLLDISPVSIRRYRAQARSTPDTVASRLHFVASLVGDLAGAYNEFGIRRWLERPRAALDSRSPAELLSGDWSPEDPSALKVRDLARSLSASPAT
jgi:uncharacterized protein (DUF2384 family)